MMPFAKLRRLNIHSPIATWIHTLSVPESPPLVAAETNHFFLFPSWLLFPTRDAYDGLFSQGLLQIAQVLVSMTFATLNRIRDVRIVGHAASRARYFLFKQDFQAAITNCGIGL